MDRYHYETICTKLDEEDFSLNDGESYFSGILFDTYPNGSIKYEKSILEGRLDGPYKLYYENAQPKLLGMMEKSKKLGEWRYFDESGRLCKKAYYNFGVLVSYQKYNEAGVCVEELNSNGLETGMNTQEDFKQYYPNGQIKTHIIAVYGIIRERYVFNSDGRLVEQYRFEEASFDMNFF